MLSSSNALIFVALGLGVFGICMTLWPRQFWYFQNRNQFKNPEAVEPSNYALQQIRINGICFLFACPFIIIFLCRH